MLFSAKPKVDHFNFIIKENENDQRQLFKVVKGLCRSLKESPLPEHDCKGRISGEFWSVF